MYERKTMLQFCQSKGKYETYERKQKTKCQGRVRMQKSLPHFKFMGWYLNGAGATVDGWREPVDCTIIVNQDVDVECHIKLPIITVGKIINLHFNFFNFYVNNGKVVGWSAVSPHLRELGLFDSNLTLSATEIVIECLFLCVIHLCGTLESSLNRLQALPPQSPRPGKGIKSDVVHPLHGYRAN